MNLVITQAAATGLPVIATLHSGLPDQIRDGVSGFLVPEGDFKVLAEKILYLIEHPDVWASFGKAARSHVSQKYDSEVLLAKQLEWYEKVIHDE